MASTAEDLGPLPGRLFRRKRILPEDPQLVRVLNVYDLTFLGIGSCLGLGLGIYAWPGELAKTVTGPAVGVSFLIAALFALLTSFCYAESVARIPCAGSAYIFSYMTMGELVAFTVGWSLLLEYMMGAANVARSLSVALDIIAEYKISSALKHGLEINAKFVSQYFDVLALVVVLMSVALIVLSVRIFARLNTVLTAVSLLAIAFVIAVGSTKANLINWHPSKAQVPKKEYGKGGFFPYGLVGVLDGAAHGYFAFLPFDVIASAVAEAKNPGRNAPIAIFVSLAITFLVYFLMGTVLTLMVPYYDISLEGPWIDYFTTRGMTAGRWCTIIGTLTVAYTALIGNLFPMSRVIYAMSRDGLVFKFLSLVNEKIHSPLVATLTCGILTGLVAMFLDVDELIEVGVISVILPYTVVSVSIILLHYKDDEPKADTHVDATPGKVLRQMFNISFEKKSNPFTACIARCTLCIYVVLNLLLGLIMTLFDRSAFFMVVLGITVLLLMFCILVIGLQPKSSMFPEFKVPMVPFIPCLSITVNINLCFKMMLFTWWTLALWMLIGYFIYFGLRVMHYFDEGLSRQIERSEETGTKKSESK